MDADVPETPGEARRPHAGKAAFDPRDVIPHPIACCDPAGRIVWINRAAEKLLGQPLSEWRERPYTETILPDHRRRVARRILERMRAGSPEGYVELPVVSGEGATRWVGLRYARLESSTGQSVFVGSIQDLHDMHMELTDALEKVRGLEAQRREAQAAASMRSEIIETVSREIRMPMEGIFTMGRILIESELDRDQTMCAEIVEQSARSLLTLVDDMLDFGRIEIGRLVLHPITFDVRVIVDHVASAFGPRASECGVRFRAQVQPMVPSALRGDPGRLRQVLLSLGEVFLGPLAGGSLDYEIGLRDESAEVVTVGIRLRIESDSDPHPDLGPLVEALGTHADREIEITSAQTLRAATARHIVGLMGGRISTIAGAPRSWTLELEIPLRRSKEPVTAALPSVESLADLRVLIVEGLEQDAHLWREWLEASGVQVSVRSSLEGMEGLLNGADDPANAWDVALINAVLPGMSLKDLGLDRTGGNPGPIRPAMVMVTDMGRPGDALRAQQLGCRGYLPKPFTSEILCAVVLEVARSRNETAGSSAGSAQAPLVTRHSVAERSRRALRVLLVEDNPIDQIVAVSGLRRLGYEPLVVTTGPEAVAAWESQGCDIAFMDVRLPEFDGIEAAREIRRKEGPNRRVPIIAVTHQSRGEDRERCLEAGMDDFVIKPIDVAILAAKIEQWTGRDRFSLTASEPDAERPAPDPGEEETTQVPLFDRERLQRSSMGDTHLERLLVATFISTAPPRLERLDLAVRGEDWKAVEYEARAMRGLCATVGGIRCASQFEEIERIASDPERREISRHLDRALGDVESLQQELNSLDLAS